ncbi:MAG: hypothetical protein ACFFD9_03135, partial [Candidatus Thorarchaeota archaeon]
SYARMNTEMIDQPLDILFALEEVASSVPRTAVITKEMDAQLVAASSIEGIGVIKPGRLARQRREVGEKKERSKDRRPEVIVEPLEVPEPAPVEPAEPEVAKKPKKVTKKKVEEKKPKKVTKKKVEEKKPKKVTKKKGEEKKPKKVTKKKAADKTKPKKTTKKTTKKTAAKEEKPKKTTKKKAA